jgi:Methyltransferase domain
MSVRDTIISMLCAVLLLSLLLSQHVTIRKFNEQNLAVKRLLIAVRRIAKDYSSSSYSVASMGTKIASREDAIDSKLDLLSQRVVSLDAMIVEFGSQTLELRAHLAGAGNGDNKLQEQTQDLAIDTVTHGNLFATTSKQTVPVPFLDEFLVTYRKEHPMRPYYPTREELFQYIYFNTGNPYVGFDATPYRKRDFTKEYPSFAFVNREMLREIVKKRLDGPPRLSVEVGCFVGSGAVGVWAPLAKENAERASEGGLHLCVDTWQGDINMRLTEEFRKFMDIKNGFPTLHHQFLAHMIMSNNTETVFPVSLPSLVGARFLAALEWKIDVVYVDSAHELDETGLELSLYYSLVRKGGLLLGDDYEMFPAVKHDVDIFVKENGLRLELLGSGQWLVQKP